jgi:hypothetical protein
LFDFDLSLFIIKRYRGVGEQPITSQNDVIPLQWENLECATECFVLNGVGHVMYMGSSQ